MEFCDSAEDNFNEWLAMGIALWPHAKRCLKEEFLAELHSDKHKHFLSRSADGEYIGFINISIRVDYIQGASTSPVGYIEGVYVKPEYRKQGVAKALIEQAERWVSEQGCQELGSDTELENIDSQKFHERAGFAKTGVIVHYIKKVKHGVLANKKPETMSPRIVVE